MTTDGRSGAELQDGGNLWDGDADSEGFRFLSNVAAQFAFFMKEHRRWIQEDPYAGKDAATQLTLGQQLEFVGRAMQIQAAQRAEVMTKYGDAVLSHLATLPRNERISLDAIAREIGGVPELVVMVLNDLARSEFVDVWRARPGRLGSPRQPTLYAISVRGRLRLERSTIMAAPPRIPIEGKTSDER